MLFSESSFNDLYTSAVVAFPKTTKRQHATQPIIIENVRWVPYKGVKTLYIKALARNEDRHYEPSILFKRVNYLENPDSSAITIDTRIYGEATFRKLSLEATDILVRCNCDDFRYRFAYYNHLDKSLNGRVPPKYESLGVGPPANPKELPGMCKHCMKLFEVLRHTGVFHD